MAIDTLDDMQTLFGGIDLGAVTVSMTINAPAAIMMAFYVMAAEGAGVPRRRLGGTIQADILKEYIAQSTSRKTISGRALGLVPGGAGEGVVLPGRSGDAPASRSAASKPSAPAGTAPPSRRRWSPCARRPPPTRT